MLGQLSRLFFSPIILIFPSAIAWVHGLLTLIGLSSLHAVRVTSAPPHTLFSTNSVITYCSYLGHQKDGQTGPMWRYGWANCFLVSQSVCPEYCPAQSDWPSSCNVPLLSKSWNLSMFYWTFTCWKHHYFIYSQLSLPDHMKIHSTFPKVQLSVRIYHNVTR